MPQPKPSTTEMSMPTFETLEEWTRSQIQSLMQSVLDEEVTHALGRSRYERQAPLDAPGGYRNGYGKRRRLSLTSGTIEVKRPRFAVWKSALRVRYCRCSPGAPKK